MPPDPWSYVFNVSHPATARGVRRAGAASAAGALVVNVNTTDNIQADVTRRFLSTQRQAAQVNRRVARGVQDGAAVYTYDKLLRPSVSTGRLMRAYRDPGHYMPAPGGSQFGFQLFNVDKLDRSEAKYWRAIEYGTREVFGGRWTGPMVDAEGIPLFGRWGGSISGSYTNRWGKVPRAGSPWGASRGKLLVAPKSVREAMVRSKTGRRPAAPKRTKHIAPRGGIEWAWRNFGNVHLVRELEKLLIEESGLLP